MNIDYSRSAYANKDSDSENWWQRRSGLERKLLASLVIACFLTGGCILYIVLKQTTIEKACSTPTCLQAASELTSRMDSDADPCENFFQFVCGNYDDRTYKNVKAGYKHQLDENKKNQISQIIEEPISDDDHYLIKNQKVLYEACMQQTGAEDSVKMFQETLLDELGGWPIVKNFHWRARAFDWVETMELLRRKGFPYSMFLNVGLVFSVREPENNTVVIMKPFLFPISITDEYRNPYLNYMVEVAHIFGAERHRAEIEMGEVLEFIADLHKIQEVDNSSLPWFKRETTVLQIQERYGDIPWLELINSILSPVTNITYDDYVDLPSDAYLKAFFKLMRTTLKRIQANYIIWTVLDKMIPLMSEELQQLRKNVMCEMKSQDPPKSRAEFCKEILEKRPFNILYARKYLPEEKRERIRDLFFDIKTELTTVLKETPWIDEESTQRAMEKTDSIIEIIGGPRDYFNDTIFEEFEHFHEADESKCNNSLFCMFLNTSKLEADVIYTYLDSTINGSIFHGWIQNTHVSYLMQVDVVVIPVSFLQEYYYNEDRPMYLNYAAAGVEIGTALSYGFCRNNDELWSGKTKDALQEQKQCITRTPQDNMDESDMVENAMAEQAGIKIAYKAYTNWAKKNGEELQLAGIEYKPSQLFWISSMSLRCFALNEEQNLQNSTRISEANGPFLNNPDFSNDFNCPLNSEMNPSNKCEVF